jgi:hypothetical protein
VLLPPPQADRPTRSRTGSVLRMMLEDNSRT